MISTLWAFLAVKRLYLFSKVICHTHGDADLLKPIRDYHSQQLTSSSNHVMGGHPTSTAKGLWCSTICSEATCIASGVGQWFDEHVSEDLALAPQSRTRVCQGTNFDLAFSSTVRTGSFEVG